MKTITNSKKPNTNTGICAVVRIYNETGAYSETHYDNVLCESLPEDIMESVVSGEVICVKLMPNVEAFYFEKPKDWPDNWAELGE